MKRLYRKIYLTIVGSLVLVVVLAGAVWQIGGDRPSDDTWVLAGRLVGTVLPAATQPDAVQQQVLDRLTAELETGLALYDGDGALIAATVEDLPRPSDRDSGGWTYGDGGPAWTVALEDGRRLVVAVSKDRRNPVIGLVLFLGVVAIAVGIGAYPVARGLTRRLERLKTGVETLGSGDLAARVTVEGKDEVAHLATSFNAAAERIEALVAAHRMMLANASHELRTPLSRIRLGLDLYEKTPSEKLKAELNSDIAELDRLVDEILLASRLDHAPQLNVESVDLLALCAEECARFDDTEFEGAAAVLDGDAGLLRSLVRNLLENAHRHGRPPVLAVLEGGSDGAILDVLDHGPGVPEADRGRIFEPFYRATGAGSGIGLGLSLVGRIARLHGGEASVIQDEARGMNGFRVTLRSPQFDSDES